MSIRSALLAVAATVVLVLAVGNQWMRDNAMEGGVAERTRANVSTQLQLEVWDMPDDEHLPMALHHGALLVLTGVLGGLAGRNRPLGAFVTGWAGFLAATVLAMGVYELTRDEVYRQPGDDLVDRITAAGGFGVAPGLWLGWLVGLAVLVGSLGQDRRGDRRPASATGGGSWPTPPPPGPQAPMPPPPATGAPSAAAGPTVGPPPDPDRTQVFGEPPARNP